MRIAYFDEAGIASEEQEPIAVVGGVLVHGDTQWHDIEIARYTIIKDQVPKELRPTFYFHATHLFSDNKRFKSLLPTATRFQILREFVTLIDRFKLPVAYGAVTRGYVAKTLPDVKPASRMALAQQFSFALCAMGFQGWFNREASDEVAICVADRKEKLEASLKDSFFALRTTGVGFATLFNFVDALHFAASEESYGLQLADAAAFLIKRHLMGKEDTEEFYKIIEPHLCVDSISALLPMPDSQE